jgi:hypothetical protein
MNMSNGERVSLGFRHFLRGKKRHHIRVPFPVNASEQKMALVPDFVLHKLSESRVLVLKK